MHTCRHNTLLPYMPVWLSGLTARLYGASQTVLEVNRLAGNGTQELVVPEPVGLGLSWLDRALDFSSWAVRGPDMLLCGG